MNKLMHELTRLYLMPDSVTEETLERRQRGEDADPVVLEGSDGATRAIVIPFRRLAKDTTGQHWERLCEVANVLQTQFGLPAPGVSVSAVDGFYLWLSLLDAVPGASAREFVELLRSVRFPDMGLPPAAPATALELPPCLNLATGRWAAFIHPGMGASFVDEPGLDMAPPAAAQASFLEGLDSIDGAQFRQALDALRAPVQPAAPAAPPLPPLTLAAATGAPDLLLRDATLEDIVRHLHAKGIEPTFRHVLRG
jgi:hypothetical protein